MGLKVDTSQALKAMKKLTDMPDEVMTDAFPFLKGKTPIKEGNARNKTRYRSRDLSIRSEYGYAGRLDDGWSKQAPQGFTEPTIKEIDKLIDQYIRDL